MLYTWIIVIISLLLCSIKDIQKKEIAFTPILLGLGAILGLRAFNGPAFNYLDSALTAILCFIIYLAIALKFNGGGGDAIVMSIVGFVFGIRITTYIIILTSIIYSIFLLIQSKRKKVAFTKVSLPYIPALTSGCVITFLFIVFCNLT